MQQIQLDEGRAVARVKGYGFRASLVSILPSLPHFLLRRFYSLPEAMDVMGADRIKTYLLPWSVKRVILGLRSDWCVSNSRVRINGMDGRRRPTTLRWVGKSDKKPVDL